MTKTDLVAKIADDTGLTKKQAEAALNSFLATITDELKAGNKVALIGFGTFETTVRAARTGKNPSTGEKISIPSSVSPKFKAGKVLKYAVNK